VHNVSETLVPATSPLEIKISIAKLRKHKSPGSDQIPAELITVYGIKRFISGGSISLIHVSVTK
jgi:hypothetical protein